MGRFHLIKPIVLPVLLMMVNLTYAAPMQQPPPPSINVEAGTAIVVTLNTQSETRLDSSGFGLQCTQAGAVTFTVSGSGSTYEITPANPLPSGDLCTLSVFVDGTQGSGNFLVGVSTTFKIADSSVTVTPEATETPIVPAPTQEMTSTPTNGRGSCSGTVMAIEAIQGSGATFAQGGTQTIEGIVIGDFEDDDIDATFDLRGFYVQDAGDGNAATSDGIFVFTNSTDSFVNLGDWVRVTGTISEFPTSGPSETQLSVSDGQNISVCSSNNPLPLPEAVTLPFNNAGEPEQYEGMLVTFSQQLSVTELFQLGRHNELVLSSGGRLPQPTFIANPGTAAQTVMQANELNQIVVDDATLTQNPDPIIFPAPELTASNTVRGGYTITQLKGVFTQSRGRAQSNGNATIAYRIRVSAPLSFDSVPNPRPTAPPDVGAATLKIASANLLNYFNTFTNDSVGCFLGGTTAPTNCRGANNQMEYERQRAKTVSALSTLNADIIGVNELENDAGSNQAMVDLVDHLNTAVGAGTYQFIDTGRIGTDAIRIGLIYKPATVTPVGNFAILDNVDPFNRNTRPPLAQLWRENATSEQFYVVANHFKSKSTTDCPASGTNSDRGDGQSCWNDDRVAAANQVVHWITTNAYFQADPDVLLIGDLNSYAKEDPIQTLAANGFTNLIEQHIGANAYSFAFDAQWGYLDYALANASLLPQITGVGEFHINADEPSVLDYNTEFKTPHQIGSLYSPDFYRISDHDPVLVGLDLGSH